MGAYQNLLKEADGTLAEGVTGQLQAAMTEGTASQLVGLWNTTASDVRAIRDWLLTGTVTVPESPFNMTQMIELQNEIAVNTRGRAPPGKESPSGGCKQNGSPAPRPLRR